MEGEPGFFGSYGFTEWAGVGEASPIGVAHELGQGLSAVVVTNLDNRQQ